MEDDTADRESGERRPGTAAGILRGLWGDASAWLERERAAWDRPGRGEGYVGFVDGGATQLRWNAAAIASALDEFGAVPAADLEPGERWLRDGLVFAVESPEGLLFPAFQFADGEPRPVIARILAALQRQLGGWEILLWFTGSSGYLDGARPVDQLVADPNGVIAAATYQASLSED